MLRTCQNLGQLRSGEVTIIKTFFDLGNYLRFGDLLRRLRALTACRLPFGAAAALGGRLEGAICLVGSAVPSASRSGSSIGRCR